MDAIHGHGRYEDRPDAFLSTEDGADLAHADPPEAPPLHPLLPLQSLQSLPDPAGDRPPHQPTRPRNSAGNSDEALEGLALGPSLASSSIPPAPTPEPPSWPQGSSTTYSGPPTPNTGRYSHSASPVSPVSPVSQVPVPSSTCTTPPPPTKSCHSLPALSVLPPTAALVPPPVIFFEQISTPENPSHFSPLATPPSRQPPSLLSRQSSPSPSTLSLAPSLSPTSSSVGCQQPPPATPSSTARHPTPLSRPTHVPASTAISITSANKSGNGSSPLSTAAATTTSSSTPQNTTLQPRKPSPGLAARLKALGFGTTPRSPSPSHPDHVGRLPEHQIRHIDETHQANSVTPAIERRGRPWKGTGPTALARSVSDAVHSAVTSSTRKSRTDKPATVAAAARDDADEPSPVFLPEIPTTAPLDMDTRKYILPDHTNGNGTKVQLDTRREHIERTLAISPPPHAETAPPPPPPKNSPPPSPPALDFGGPGLTSYFTPGHQRAGSIYTLSRLSFANQLAQLTSLQLPDAESLSSRVSAIPTAQAAATALINAAEQIRSWISKASEVIGGLDSDDDVEWAAAGGREGLEEVERAILRFEELINVYVSAIEELQSRSDIARVAPDDLNRAVFQMEAIMTEWSRIRGALHVVREQVEIAMEWEELWNNVLGDIQNEMDELSRLVFEMEERRHKSLIAAAAGADALDIGDLETIVEETPPQAADRLQAAAQHRFSLPAYPLSPSSPSTPFLSLDDSSLLGLFARMQPLRASLDFLPMRLSVFETRAEKSFPTACEELEMRRSGLDGSYRKLEKDAESLRKELGEDRWITVFRGVGRQAQKMYESIERALGKLKESIDAGVHLTSQPKMSKLVEAYEGKKTHYGPAIDRVLSLIDKGVKDRLTVNGEIVRLHSETQSRWDALKEQMRDMDTVLEELHVDKRTQQLRDSISSMLSNDRSTIGSGHETPGSSPPSSVIMTSLGLDSITPSSAQAGKRRSAGLSNNATQPPTNRRHSSLPAPAYGHDRSPANSVSRSHLPPLATPPSVTPPAARQTARPASTLGHRPRWNNSTNTGDVGTGHNFKPLSLTTPSPYAKKTPTTVRSVSSVTPASSSSKIPALRSPATRAMSESPMPKDDTPTRPSASRMSFRDRLALPPGPYSQQMLAKSRAANQSSSSSTVSDRRASLQPQKPKDPAGDTHPTRPASSLATVSRRASLLPLPKQTGLDSGRQSPQAVAGARVAMRKSISDPKPKDTRPRWRP